jgi:hypothetical protein
MCAIQAENKRWRAGSAHGTADTGEDTAVEEKMGEEEGWLMDNPILQSLLQPQRGGDRLILL